MVLYADESGGSSFDNGSSLIVDLMSPLCLGPSGLANWPCMSNRSRNFIPGRLALFPHPIPQEIP